MTDCNVRVRHCAALHSGFCSHPKFGQSQGTGVKCSLQQQHFSSQEQQSSLLSMRHCVRQLTAIPMHTPPHVILYTDGSCKGNPGPGGWAFVLQHPNSGKTLERFGSEPETTNNRMELLAVIEGLKTLTKPSSVELVSDSKYVLQGLEDWMPKWKKNGWRRKEGKAFKPVKNVELWQELDRLMSIHTLTFRHVFGHTGHPFNERCDQLAGLAALGEKV